MVCLSATAVFNVPDLRKLLLRARAAAMLHDLVREQDRLRAADEEIRELCRNRFAPFRSLCSKNGWHWKHRHPPELQRAAEDLLHRGDALVYDLVVLKNAWNCDVSLDNAGFTLDWFFRVVRDTASRDGEQLPVRPCRRMDNLRAALHMYRSGMYAAALKGDALAAHLDAFEARFPLLVANAQPSLVSGA